jgi:hypothetical protein
LMDIHAQMRLCPSIDDFGVATPTSSSSNFIPTYAGWISPILGEYWLFRCQTRLSISARSSKVSTQTPIVFRTGLSPVPGVDASNDIVPYPASLPSRRIYGRGSSGSKHVCGNVEADGNVQISRALRRNQQQPHSLGQPIPWPSKHPTTPHPCRCG